MVTRRDTPAQERVYQKQVNDDWSALRQGASWMKDRDTERDAVATAVRADTQAGSRNYGNSGSPTLRRAEDGLRSGVRRGAATVRSALDGGAPNTGPAISQREVEQNYASADALRDLRRNAPPAATSTQQVTEADGRGVSLNPGGVLSALRRGLGSAPAPAGPGAPTRMPQREGPSLVQRATDYLTRVPSGTGVGQNTPAGAGGYRVGQSQQGRTPATGTGQPNVATVNPSAITGAVQAGGDAANMGYWQAGNGPRQYIPGTQQSSGGISVMGDMGKANQEFARANAIRQQMIDSQRPQNQVTVIPWDGSDIGRSGGGGRETNGLDSQIERLVRRAGSTSDPWRRAAVNRQISQLQELAGLQAVRQQAADTNATSLQRQQLANQGALERTAMSALQTDEGEAAYNAARANYYNAQAEDLARGELEPPEPPDYEMFLAAGDDAGLTRAIGEYQAQKDIYDIQSFAQQQGVPMDELLQDYANGEVGGYLGQIMSRVYGAPEDTSYAAGGLVEASMGPSDAGMQMAGEPVGVGNAAPPPMDYAYQQYAAGAQQIGVQPVPYEDFVNLMPQAQPMPQAAPGPEQPYAQMGFADGGAIPSQEELLATQIGASMGGQDVSGRMVMDPDPMAETDSIPAVIDGQIPAALDSGEFVIPEHAVRFHGIDKLMKLIAQAEKGASNGQGGASSEVSAVRSSS